MEGTDKEDMALDFIKFATRTVPLSGMQDVAYGPTRRSAQALLPEDVKEDLPTRTSTRGSRQTASSGPISASRSVREFNEWLLQ